MSAAEIPAKIGPMQPDTWVSAGTGFLGGVLGGACTIFAARYQSRLQTKQQERQRDREMSQMIDGFKLEIGAIRRSDSAAFANCADIAKRMRVFFHENSGQLQRPSNRAFYETYLQQAVNPSPNYFADDEVRWLGFLTDSADLAAVRAEREVG